MGTCEVRSNVAVSAVPGAFGAPPVTCRSRGMGSLKSCPVGSWRKVGSLSFGYVPLCLSILLLLPTPSEHLEPKQFEFLFYCFPDTQIGIGSAPICQERERRTGPYCNWPSAVKVEHDCIPLISVVNE